MPSVAQTRDRRALDGGGRERALRAPRGQRPPRAPPHPQSGCLLSPRDLPLPARGWGLTVKGPGSRDRGEGNPTSPTRGSGGLFSRHKRWKSRGGGGTNEGKPANGSGPAADGDRLSPPANRVRGEPPAPSPARGGVSARGLLNLVSARPPSAARNPAPGPRLRAPAAGLAAPPRAGGGAAFLRRSVRSFSLGTGHPAAPRSPSRTPHGPGVREAHQPHAVWSAGGRRRTSGGVATRRERQRLPRPPRPTRPRGSARRGRTEAKPEGARPAAGPGRRGGRGPPRPVGRRRTEALPQRELQGSRPLSPGRARGKGNRPIFSSPGAPFLILNKNNWRKILKRGQSQVTP